MGVDPGISGAFAVLEPGGRLVEVFDTPRSRDGTDLDARALAARLKPFGISRAIVEDVGAMTYTQTLADGSRQKRGQGAAASFAFGRYAGIVHGILAALDIPMLLVKPAVWKACYGLTRDKSLSLELARLKFPSHEDFFTRLKDDGRAEAALIALFGLERLF